MNNLFKIRKDERVFAAVVAVVLALYNAMVVIRYNEMISSTERWFTWKFCKHYELSGFDPFPYSILSYWSPEYNVFRHPLFAILLYPFYLLNHWLTALTGENCAMLVMLIPIIAAGFYSMVFLRRIFEEQVGVKKNVSVLLTLTTFSFAYVMLAMVAADHFVFSMFLLILTLYIVGRHHDEGKPLGILQTALLALSAGGNCHSHPVAGCRGRLSAGSNRHTSKGTETAGREETTAAHQEEAAHHCQPKR